MLGESAIENKRKSEYFYARFDKMLVFLRPMRAQNKFEPVFRNMKNRCYNPINSSYKNYGARGIFICDEWLKDPNSFYLWAEDGFQPGLSIDRIDNNGPYSPENCRWATSTQQGRNKRNNSIIEFKGQKLCVSEVAEIIKMEPGILHKRLRMGWSIERATTTPTRPDITDDEAKAKRKKLREIIKEKTGLTLLQFGEQYLDSQYMALSYRIRHGVLRLWEYHIICFYTGMTFEQLWPNPHVPQPRKISLNLNHQTLPSNNSGAADIRRALALPPINQYPEVTLKEAAGMAPQFSEQDYETVSHKKPPGDEGTQKKGEVNPRPAFVDPYEGMVPPEI